MTTVSGLRPRSDGTWDVDTERTGARLRKGKKTYSAANVVLAAGTWGTQNLLHKMKDTGALPKLSDTLGELTRTNSESIVGAGRFNVSSDLDLTHGVAITSSIHPDDRGSGVSLVPVELMSTVLSTGRVWLYSASASPRTMAR